MLLQSSGQQYRARELFAKSMRLKAECAVDAAGSPGRLLL
jgi:hypothetical protein